MFHTMDGRKVVENLEEFDDAREVRAQLGLPQHRKNPLHLCRASTNRHPTFCFTQHGAHMGATWARLQAGISI